MHRGPGKWYTGHLQPADFLVHFWDAKHFLPRDLTSDPGFANLDLFTLQFQLTSQSRKNQNLTNILIWQYAVEFWARWQKNLFYSTTTTTTTTNRPLHGALSNSFILHWLKQSLFNFQCLETSEICCNVWRRKNYGGCLSYFESTWLFLAKNSQQMITTNILQY